MAEREHLSETWCIGAPWHGPGPLVLWPIERLVVNVAAGRRLCWCSMHKEAVAIIVRDAIGLRAIGCDGAPLPLQPLRERLPQLDAVLAAG